MDNELDKLRIKRDHLEELKKISGKLHRLGENSCNYGLTPRREKVEERLEKRAGEIAGELGFRFYYQRDPRGCPVYLVPADWDEYQADQWYSTNGLAIY